MFQREEGTFLNSFYETTNTLRAKLYRGSTKKESYRPMSFMNIAVKLLIKILANVNHHMSIMTIYLGLMALA